MRNRSKLLLVSVAATALLGMAVSSASAAHFELRNWERGFRISWNQLSLTTGATVIRCPITLEGSFTAHTYNKTPGLSVGRVTAAAVRNEACTGGHLTLLANFLPWSITYNSFTGTLPTITGVKWNFIGMAFNLEMSGVNCLALTRTERPARGIANVTSGTSITSFTAEEAETIETSGGFLCSFNGPGKFSGTGTASTQSGGAIEIALI